MFASIKDITSGTIASPTVLATRPTHVPPAIDKFQILSDPDPPLASIRFPTTLAPKMAMPSQLNENEEVQTVHSAGRMNLKSIFP